MASPGTSLRVIAVVAPALLAGFSLSAQNVDSIRASYILALPPGVEVTRPVIRSAPGSSSGTPTAYGAEFGDVFFDAGYQQRARYTRDLPWRQGSDGWVGLGFGLGNSRRSLGIELAFTSFSTIRSGFFRTTSFSFKVHRALPWNLAVAYGWDDAIHSSGTDGGSSQYGVLTSYIRTRESSESPFSSVTLSVGVGNSRFLPEQAFYDGRNGVNAFGSIGVRVFSPISLLADWTGQDLMLGASIVPFARVPLFITPSFADVTGNAGDGARFVLGVGMNFNFSRN
jgi:hypothetical protein